MSDLFIRLFLDEDVDVLVADLIKARGFAAFTTTGEGRKGVSDAAQMAYASANGLTLLTHNRVDFEALAQEYFAAGQNHYGVIIAVRRSPQELAQRALIMLNRVTVDEMVNQVRYI